MTLTDDQMRVAIAEKCPSVFLRPDGMYVWNPRDGEPIEFDPLNCLNACADFEKALFKDEILWRSYRNHIYDYELHNDTAFATARQRCAAFCAVMNLLPVDRAADGRK